MKEAFPYVRYSRIYFENDWGWEEKAKIRSNSIFKRRKIAWDGKKSRWKDKEIKEAEFWTKFLVGEKEIGR